MLEEKCYFCGNSENIEIYTTEVYELAVCGNCKEKLHACGYCGKTLHPSEIKDGFPKECEHCKTQVKGYYYSHGYRYKPIILEDEPENTITYGTELEITKGRYSIEDNELLRIRNTYPNIICNDSSINGNGFEIISMPMSLRKWKSQELEIKNLFSYLVGNNYMSHDDGSCGLHIHATRPSEEVIDRIIFIMEFYKDELKKFARRGGNSYNRWYSEYNNENAEKVKCLSEIKSIWNFDSNRYMVLNTQNEKTIEFRLFRGTLNFETYFASIELVDNIMRLCSDLKKPVSQITWKSLTSTPFAKKYCKEKNITCDRRPIDYSKKMLKNKVTFIKDKNRIINLLLDEYNKAVDEFNTVKVAKVEKVKINQEAPESKFADIQVNMSRSQSEKDVLALRLKNFRTIIGEFMNTINYRAAKNVLNMRNLALSSETNEKIKKIIAKGEF